MVYYLMSKLCVPTPPRFAGKLKDTDKLLYDLVLWS